MVVDDDKDFRDLIVGFLEEEGFGALEAGSGDIALEMIEREKPDLILLDIKIPEQSGLDVCRALKAQPATAAIPVVIITGSSSLNDKLAGYLSGAMRYLIKPFALGELGECVRNILYRQDEPAEAE